MSTRNKKTTTETRSAVLRGKVEPSLKKRVCDHIKAKGIQRTESFVVRQAVIEYMERHSQAV